jgi:hypothetical protein
MTTDENNRLLAEFIDHLYTVREEDKILEFFQSKYTEALSDNDIGRVIITGKSSGFIEEREDFKHNLHFSLTHEGFNMLSVYGNYLTYIENKQEEVLYKKKIQKLKLQNMVLVNMKIKLFIITSLLSFIAGILLSDPIKSIWKHILSISE